MKLNRGIDSHDGTFVEGEAQMLPPPHVVLVNVVALHEISAGETITSTEHSVLTHHVHCVLSYDLDLLLSRVVVSDL